MRKAKFKRVMNVRIILKSVNQYEMQFADRKVDRQSDGEKTLLLCTPSKEIVTCQTP
jgi:hypothetical protein